MFETPLLGSTEASFRGEWQPQSHDARIPSVYMAFALWNLRGFKPCAFVSDKMTPQYSCVFLNSNLYHLFQVRQTGLGELWLPIDNGKIGPGPQIPEEQPGSSHQTNRLLHYALTWWHLTHLDSQRILAWKPRWVTWPHHCCVHHFTGEKNWDPGRVTDLAKCTQLDLKPSPPILRRHACVWTTCQHM